MDPMHGPGILGVMFLGTVSSSSVHKCALILIPVSSKLSSPLLHHIWWEKNASHQRQPLILFPTSTDIPTTAPSLPSLLQGKRWPHGCPKAKSGLETESVCPHTLSNIPWIPAAKTAFLTTFLAQSIISPGKQLGESLTQGNITCGRPRLWSPCRCLWFSGAGTQHRTTSLPSLHMPKRYLWPAWTQPSLIPLRWYLSHEPATDH